MSRSKEQEIHYRLSQMVVEREPMKKRCWKCNSNWIMEDEDGDPRCGTCCAQQRATLRKPE